MGSPGGCMVFPGALNTYRRLSGVPLPAIRRTRFPPGYDINAFRVKYITKMLKEYLRILKNHSDDVFGVGARKTLSIYTILSIACVVVPVLFFLILLVSKVF